MSEFGFEQPLRYDMKTQMLLTVLLIGAVPSAFAHTHLEKTSPADGAILDGAPRELTFHFSEPTRLTATTIQKEGEKQPVALKSTTKTPAKDVNLTLPSPPASGKYVVSWRAVGADSHVMSGKFRFTIAAR